MRLHEVEQAADGEEGIRKIHQGSFDFIICDIKMPKVSGLDVLASVIESSWNVPVIMISVPARWTRRFRR